MQVLLDIGAAENAPPQFGAIVGPVILPEQRIGLEQDPQRIAADWHTTFDEMQVKTDAARGDEPPGRDLVSRPARAYTASEVEVRVPLCNLEPQVSLRLRFISARQHPRSQHSRLFPGGVDATGVGVQ
jgi:hypothetical protein